jgi:hypothetical protein
MNKKGNTHSLEIAGAVKARAKRMGMRKKYFKAFESRVACRVTFSWKETVIELS